TMDEGLSAAVQTVFKKMYDDELIYRAERIINWCPRCLTAISASRAFSGVAVPVTRVSGTDPEPSASRSSARSAPPPPSQ
ncbi:hypothetical protein DLE01_07605, partial [Streptomyces sp. FT05W]